MVSQAGKAGWGMGFVPLGRQSGVWVLFYWEDWLVYGYCSTVIRRGIGYVPLGRHADVGMLFNWEDRLAYVYCSAGKAGWDMGSVPLERQDGVWILFRWEGRRSMNTVLLGRQAGA